MFDYLRVVILNVLASTAYKTDLNFNLQCLFYFGQWEASQ